MDIFDLIILGGGPAGYCAAERAGAAGMSTLLIEQHALGGVCLNEGCIPSKTLLHSAKILHYAQHSQAFGVSTTGATADPAVIVARKDQVVKKLVQGVAAQMKRHGVQVAKSKASLQGRSADGFIVKTQDATYTAKKLLLATGSQPVIPPIPGIHEGIALGSIWTSREALNAKIMPTRLCIIGGGVIGMEMASYFSAMGVKVTVIEMMPTIGGAIDAKLAASLQKSYAKAIDCKLGCKVVEFTQNHVYYERQGVRYSVETDQILLCIGRRPSSDGLHLDTLSVATERGAVLTDACGRTNIPDLYAAGDINGKSMLAHTAYREAECAVATMLGTPQQVDYDTIPQVIYTTPEVACVGLSIQQAEQQGYQVQSVTLPMSYAGRFLAETNESEGFLIMVADQTTRRLLGVHMIGPYASEIIVSAALMVSTHMTIEALRQQVFPHPTVSEILREALFEI